MTYGDIDRDERQLLPRVFKMLQDAAIEHANLFGTGTNAVATRAESWVLNRIVVEIARYPRPGEALKVETWSTGIKGFKGYRDFRVCDSGGRQVMTASSLWLYIRLASKSIVRVPREVADIFPIGEGVACCPELEQLPFDVPGSAATAVPVTLRYSDFDVNNHVNNAAYLDFVQTALARVGAPKRPRQVRLKYAKEIPLDADRVDVRVEQAGADAVFSVERDGVVFAVGRALG
ncbi:acyl-ACP thioesterase domain-containing protein [Opitutus sp. ER46]|uniref:acyl-[acyl-carrier-protein] thioesterase n=1 Tax=Opitutus sp. ER46 TaxID=2161864 RepID=UPI001304C51B|nr:acyl-ACP thioesterase domain-containing protein [Opitutus sp. ER46]